jgi:hypothetical protein
LTEADRRDVAFAELAADDERTWLSPIYLDDKRHVDVAAVLIAVAVAGRAVRPEARQCASSGTYLVPPRRRELRP